MLNKKLAIKAPIIKIITRLDKVVIWELYKRLHFREMRLMTRKNKRKANSFKIHLIINLLAYLLSKHQLLRNIIEWQGDCLRLKEEKVLNKVVYQKILILIDLILSSCLRIFKSQIQEKTLIILIKR
jgi:hypothetical protein